MTENDNTLSEPFAGSLGVIDVPLLRTYIQETSRWLIGEAVGEQLPGEQCDELAKEIAVVLADGLTPSLSAEIVRNTEKVIADSQQGPVSFDWRGQLTVAGIAVPDLLRLLDAVGQLIHNGAGDTLALLHASHQRALYNAHEAWLAKQPEPQPDA
jgi:hypothetical protein